MSSKDFFGENTKEWNWKDFQLTRGFPISENLLDWVIGQEKAMEECKLCLDEWIHKLKGLKKRKWWRLWAKPELEKPFAKDQLSPAPSIFLLGDAGTGKSLIGRALAYHLLPLYKKYGISLFDVLCWKNAITPSEPKISICPSPKGKGIVSRLRKKAMKKNRLTKWGFRLFQGAAIGFGMFIMGMLIFYLFNNWTTNAVNAWGYHLQEFYKGDFLRYFVEQIMLNAQMFFLGITCISMGAMLYIFKHIIGRFGGTQKGIGGAESIDSPKLIIDNSRGKPQFVDATGHGSAQLFGSIAWDPLQTGGMGTPEHQRVTAGDVHRAFMGILYIDEIKNLNREEAITLLTVLEDGQLPIALRSKWHSGGTSAMAVSTEPVPCLNFLVVAGNFDSIPHIHHALMDRITGYGRIVRMNNEMPNTVENRRKYVQFIAQEVKRFNLIPLNREACIEIIGEGRRKSGFNDKLTTRFRPMISIIKTSAILAINEGKEIVEKRHVREAIDKHCKTIHRQLLEHWINSGRPFVYVDPKEKPRTGKIAGLTVSRFANDDVGEVGIIKASMLKVPEKIAGKYHKPYFKVTGVTKSIKSKWIQDSIAKVRHVMIEKYDIDPAIDYKTMIDFQQKHGVDGPSAGITMLLALISILTRKKIRQDVAVTGEITIDSEGKYIITPIGGVDAKIRAAQHWNYQEVVIPKRNYDSSINPDDYEIKVTSAETLEDYMKRCFVDDDQKT